MVLLEFYMSKNFLSIINIKQLSAAAFQQAPADPLAYNLFIKRAQKFCEENKLHYQEQCFRELYNILITEIKNYTYSTNSKNNLCAAVRVNNDDVIRKIKISYIKIKEHLADYGYYQIQRYKDDSSIGTSTGCCGIAKISTADDSFDDLSSYIFIIQLCLALSITLLLLTAIATFYFHLPLNVLATGCIVSSFPAGIALGEYSIYRKHAKLMQTDEERLAKLVSDLYTNPLTS
jgi:hypothetical protein